VSPHPSSPPQAALARKSARLASAERDVETMRQKLVAADTLVERERAAAAATLDNARRTAAAAAADASRAAAAARASDAADARAALAARDERIAELDKVRLLTCCDWYETSPSSDTRSNLDDKNHRRTRLRSAALRLTRNDRALAAAALGRR